MKAYFIQQYNLCCNLLQELRKTRRLAIIARNSDEVHRLRLNIRRAKVLKRNAEKHLAQAESLAA